MGFNQTFFETTPQYGKRAMFANTWHEEDGQGYLFGGRRDPYDFNDGWRTKNGDPAGEYLRLSGHGSGGANIWTPRSYITAEPFRRKVHIVGGFDINKPNYMAGGHFAYANGGRDLTIYPEPPLEAREAYGLTDLDDLLVLIGGVTYKDPVSPNPLRAFADGWGFDKFGRWHEVITDAPWGEIRSHGQEKLNNYLWLWGGYNSADQLLDKLWRWDGVNAPVEKAPLPVPTGGAITCAANGKLWNICGSIKVNGVTVQTRAVSSYDPSTDEWSPHNDFPSEERFGGRALVRPGTPDRIFVYGGAKGNSPNRVFHVDVHSTTDGDTWDEHTSCTLYGGT